jgi:hypothetical protein
MIQRVFNVFPCPVHAHTLASAAPKEGEEKRKKEEEERG